MARMLAAFAAHAPYQDLPSVFAAQLGSAGLQPLGQRPVPVLNASYGENSDGAYFFCSTPVLTEAARV